MEQLAPVPALATIAASTERIRIGTFVFNNDLRHPAVLAQELATSTLSAAVAWRSGSEPAGTSPSTTRSACPSTWSRRG